MIDYLEDSDGDLLLSGGDFAKGDCTQKHQTDLLMAVPGEYKQAPTATIGAMLYINDDDVEGLLRDVRLKFSADGMRVVSISRDLKVVAYYGK